MSASLVGSEMCIRDSSTDYSRTRKSVYQARCWVPSSEFLVPVVLDTVSYTHLTLPTICSV
eukprot:8951019-Alexandrium_andersonii.AAC.1